MGGMTVRESSRESRREPSRDPVRDAESGQAREPSWDTGDAGADLLGAVQAIVGEAHALPGAELFPHGIDGVVPRVVAFPADAGQIRAILALANERRLAVIPYGGGTQLGLGNPPERADIALSLSRLDKIVAYEPADMTVTVQAGVTLQALQRHLARHGQCLPFDPALPGRATVGGMIATREAGPLRQAFRGIADRLLGIEVVTADGKRAKAGGRVVKNVSGYEMGRLYTGSLGTLAVIVEATFKVQPRFETAAALIAAVDGVDEAASAIRALLDSDAEPVMLELLGGQARSDSSNGSGAPAPPGASAVLVAGYAGTPADVSWQLDEAARRLTEALEGKPDACQRVPWTLAHQLALRAHRADAEQVIDLARDDDGKASAPGDVSPAPVEAAPVPGSAPAAAAVLAWLNQLAPPLITCRVHVRPSTLTRFLARVIESDAGRDPVAGGRLWFAAHAGSGIVRVHVTPPSTGSKPSTSSTKSAVIPAQLAPVWSPEVEERLAAFVDSLRAESAAAGGFVVVEHAPPSFKRRVSVFGPPGQDFMLHRAIKERMDPNRILNPGRFIGNL